MRNRGPGNSPDCDLVTLGETMIRHFTRSFLRIEQSSELGFSIAGSESNLAVAASRLGLTCGWISKLVDNPLGHKVEREIAGNGVDTSRVVWTRRGRVGVFYIEFGSPPRPTEVIYDRENSAASKLKPQEVDWDYVRRFKWFHTTGITCALSESCLRTVRRAIREAHKGITRVSLDLNYRRKLWSPARCRTVMSNILPGIDLLFAASEDLKIVFGIDGEPRKQAEEIHRRFGIANVVLTCGSQGAVALEGEGEFHEMAFDRYPVREVDRIGAGDAFAAGFFAGMMEKGFDLGLLYGAATGALKYSIPGDMALVSRSEMLEVALGRKNAVNR